MAIVENTLVYHDGSTELEAFFAFDDSVTARRPGVLISHTWGGRDSFVAEKARKLAALGYVGFALDMYGKGILGTGPSENALLMKPFMDDRAKLQRRIKAALLTLKTLPWVDAKKTAAIGFCFGGLCVLDLGRTGADICGVVSFHGLLEAPGNTRGTKIKAKILALHGYDDPMAIPEQALAFQQEITEAGADWQFVSYGHTMHAFTNPNANNPDFGTVYQADADRRSWRAMTDFLSEIFA